ncbi:MAG: hypothetical protein EOO52_11785 [Gammaproteobacteria bacterium]|nr:MAG: hypothetical protein EOO52_11785 [Gammaproteobacteria bacterium]
MNNQTYLHKNFRYKIDYVGNERTPVLVVDDFLDNADSLARVAAQSRAFNNADAFYPGLRAPAPELYLDVMDFYLNDLVADIFGLQGSNITGVKADFSIVTTPPHQLKDFQTIPHFDSTKRSELAAVHFLSPDDKGGTSIYRHRATGFESVDATRIDAYRKIMQEELKTSRAEKKYINGSTEFYEQIASYEAIFNRLIMYPCTSLHSGNISPDFTFDANPSSGRLTLNTFIFCRE